MAKAKHAGKNYAQLVKTVSDGKIWGKTDRTYTRVDVPTRPVDPHGLVKAAYEGRSRSYPRAKPWDDGYGPPAHSTWENAPGMANNDHNGRQQRFYANDTGGGDFRRGQAKGGNAGAPSYFDHVGNPGMAKGGGKCKATGADCNSSPFSGAYRKGRGEGF
jgi:hypothetical protein